MEENTNIYIYIYYVSPGWQPSATIEESYEDATDYTMSTYQLGADLTAGDLLM